MEPFTADSVARHTDTLKPEMPLESLMGSFKAELVASVDPRFPGSCGLPGHLALKSMLSAYQMACAIQLRIKKFELTAYQMADRAIVARILHTEIGTKLHASPQKTPVPGTADFAEKPS